jgi:glycosidase
MVVLEVNVACLGERQQCQNLIGMLPYFAELGVEILYFLPIQKMGKVKAKGSPYCLSDHWEFSEAWGTEEDWNQLLAICQQHQMKCILDWVMNHTAWDHPWLQQFPDRYLLNGQGEMVHPPGTDWTDVAQLDVNHPEVISAMTGLMQRWVIERGIQGFRWDAMKRIPKQTRCKIQSQCGENLLWLGDGDAVSIDEAAVHFVERRWLPSSSSQEDSPHQWTYLHHHDEAINGLTWKQKSAHLRGDTKMVLQEAIGQWKHPVISISMWAESDELFSWSSPRMVKIR